ELPISEPPWIRLLYTYPSTLSKSIISTVISLPEICSYFDVPVQHASSKILKRMGRDYSKDDLYDLFSYIREQDPKAALRTTIITGFPGETKEDFNDLLEFIEHVKFDHLGVFTYSDSDDLKSHALDNHVPHDIAVQRHDIIMEKQAQISYNINQKHIDKTYKVLVEEKSDDGIYLGRTRFQAPEVDGLTFIYGFDLEIGTFVDVKITEAYEYDIAGEIA
ncbi:MAG: radical SAM protein, partial [Desulfobacteraceae bacterium]|nr:radical SAM protein [Desulfobacteraceae bacterium]